MCYVGLYPRISCDRNDLDCIVCVHAPTMFTVCVCLCEMFGDDVN